MTDHVPTGAGGTDAHDLAKFGYSQELRRGLKSFSSFASSFSYISPATGIFTLFALGIGTLGGAFFWTFLAVAAGQLIVALNFAEVSTHFPLAGSVFQWTKYFSRNKTYSWFTGWIYLWAGALTIAAVVATLPLTLIPLLNNIGIGVSNSLGTQQLIAFLTLIVITLLNMFGVKLVAFINNTGVIFEILGLVVFAVIVAIFHHHQSAGVIFHTGGPAFNGHNFLIAMFMGLFVIYGFDTASTLAEETEDPRRIAPRAVWSSVVTATIVGAIFLYAMLVSLPGPLHKVIPAGIGPGQIISENLPTTLSSIYLLVVSFAIFVCCLAIQASTVRLAFGLARDRQLPVSPLFRRVSERTGTPLGACALLFVLPGIFLIQYAGAAYIAIAASGMIYATYLLCNLQILRVRLRGWPITRGKFHLGAWGMVVCVIAVVYEIGMLVNFAWPRVATNPEPNQTAGALHFGVGLFDRTPVLWLVFIAVMVVGAAYMLYAHSHIPAPEISDELAAELPPDRRSAAAGVR
ncbi:MAG: APC family permease [Solirubrobacteraceae bacterium]